MPSRIASTIARQGPQSALPDSNPANIDRAQTPTLIQHGEKDARVPIPNAYELYQGLRDHNVPVRLAVYAGFGHGIDKPKSNRAVMTHNEEWFSKWIWGEEAAETEPQ